MVECPKDYKISRLIAKKLMGVILPEDEEKLNAWLEEDARNKDLYQRILEVENFSTRDMYAKRLDVEHTWDALKEQLAGQRKRRSLFSSWQIGVAASVILLVGIGLYWGFNKKPKVKQVEVAAHVEMGGAKAILVTSRGDEIVLQDSSVQLITLGGGMVAKNDGVQVSYKENEGAGKEDVLEYNTIRVPRGGEYKLFLSDNTEVFLNSDSEIRFPVKFGKGKRDVFLRGEAFFVMVEGVEKENLIALALKIRNAIAGLELEQEFTGVSKYLTVSIGVAYTYPEKGSSFKSLYDSASDAMYTAKENGRNCVVCDGTVYGRMKNGVGTAIGN